MRGTKFYRFLLLVFKLAFVMHPFGIAGLFRAGGADPAEAMYAGLLSSVPFLPFIWYKIKCLSDFIWLIEIENARQGFPEDEVVQEEEDYETMELKREIRDRKIKRLLKMFIISMGGIITTKMIIDIIQRF